MEAHAQVPNLSHGQPQGFGLGRSVVQVPAQLEHPAIKGPRSLYVADTEVGVYAMGHPQSKEADVKTLHVQTYGGNAWNAPRATGSEAAPTVLASGLAEAQMARVMANIPIAQIQRQPGGDA